MNFLQTLPARAIIFIISIALFAVMVNNDIKAQGKIGVLTYLFGVIVILNTVNLYMAWKRNKEN